MTADEVVEVQQLLGHSSLDTTRRYLEATANELRDACGPIQATSLSSTTWRRARRADPPTSVADCAG